MNPSLHESEARGSEVQGQSGLHSEIPSQKNILVSFVSLTHVRITREERPYHEELHSSDWSVGKFVGVLS